MKINFILLVINTFIITIFVLIIFALLYFFQGSSEIYPTEEQNEKIKISFGFIIAVLAFFEGGLILIRRKVISNRMYKLIKKAQDK